MKFLFVFGLLLLANVTMAQVPAFNIDEATKQITYVEVVDEVGTKNDLYTRAIAWTNKFYKNPQDVTKVRDQENGKIECVHRIPLFDTDAEGTKIRSNLVVRYTLYIELKEGKYRYKVTNFQWSNPSTQKLERWLDKKDPAYLPKYDAYLVQIDEHIKDLIAKLKTGMKPPVVKKDEW